MDLVIDANILFSALIKNGKKRNLLIFQRFSIYMFYFEKSKKLDNLKQLVYK